MKKNIYIVPAVEINGLNTEDCIAATVEYNTYAGHSLSNESSFDDDEDFLGANNSSLWED